MTPEPQQPDLPFTTDLDTLPSRVSAYFGDLIAQVLTAIPPSTDREAIVERLAQARLDTTLALDAARQSGRNGWL